jgi:hypothetical protein
MQMDLQNETWINGGTNQFKVKFVAWGCQQNKELITPKLML